ncbi:MAG: hypothetical protein ACOY0R_14055 [Chloroflexota bacterium]
MAKRVLLYGKSVLIAGLASALAQEPDLDILRGESLESTDFTAVDLILADLGDAEAVRALPRLCTQPGVSLVGVDSPSSTLTLLSGSSQPAQTLHELALALIRLSESAAEGQAAQTEAPAADALRPREESTPTP